MNATESLMESFNASVNQAAEVSTMLTEYANQAMEPSQEVLSMLNEEGFTRFSPHSACAAHLSEVRCAVSTALVAVDRAGGEYGEEESIRLSVRTPGSAPFYTTLGTLSWNEEDELDPIPVPGAAIDTPVASVGLMLKVSRASGVNLKLGVTACATLNATWVTEKMEELAPGLGLGEMARASVGDYIECLPSYHMLTLEAGKITVASDLKALAAAFDPESPSNPLPVWTGMRYLSQSIRSTRCSLRAAYPELFTDCVTYCDENCAE